MNANACIAGLAALATLGVGPVYRQGRDDCATLSIPAAAPFTAVRARLAAAVAAGRYPSLAIVAIAEGQVVWREAIGTADIARRVAATPCTQYAVGSLSKSILATAVAIAADEGRLSLDAPVAAYLHDTLPLVMPGVETRSLRVRDLLQMAGGVAHGGGFYVGEGGPMVQSDAEKDALVRQFAVVAFPPRTVIEYSNYAYGLAERALERATGMDYPAFVTRRLFAPLGMTGASHGAGDPQRRAVRYQRDGTVYPHGTFLPLGAAGAMLTLGDLSQYAVYHLTRQPAGLVSAGTLRRLHHERAAVPGTHFATGFGSVPLDSATTWLISNGEVGGGSSHLSLLPERGIAVGVMMNRSAADGDPDLIALEILDVLYPGARARATGIIAAYEADSEQPWTARPAWAGRWDGTLTVNGSALPVTLQLNADGGIVLVGVTASPAPVRRPTYGHGVMRGTVAGPLLPAARDSRWPEGCGAPACAMWLGLVEAPRGLVGYLTIRYATRPGVSPFRDERIPYRLQLRRQS